MYNKNGAHAYTIAEIGNNHGGNLQLAKEMITAASCSGASAVKFQKRNNRKLFTKEFYDTPYLNENSFGPTYGLHRDALEFSLEEYKELKRLTEQLRMDFIVTPFDTLSVDFLEKVGVEIYKIASAELTDLQLLDYVGKTKKPIIISTGGSTLDEIQRAIDTVSNHHNDISILHCVMEYPAKKENLNLSVIKTLANSFDFTVGYSGHEIGIEAVLLCRAMGAKIIEKHFTIDKGLKGGDNAFSLNEKEFKKMVIKLQEVDSMLGSSEKIIHDYEKPAKKKMGKSIYAAKEIKKGEVITKDNIEMRSPEEDDGLNGNKFFKLIGSKSICNYNIGDLIRK